jgi:hypothetical protein
MAVGDFDADGHLDVVVASTGGDDQRCRQHFGVFAVPRGPFQGDLHRRIRIGGYLRVVERPAVTGVPLALGFQRPWNQRVV